MQEKKKTLLRPLTTFQNLSYEGKLNSGNGSMVTDEYGKQYLDMLSGLWNVPFGYSNEKLKHAVTKQMDKLPYLNSIHECAQIQIDYAEALKEYMGGETQRIFLTTSGSESVELAIKLARKYQLLKHGKSKPKIVILDHSYHGTTYAAMSASGMDSGEALSYEPIVPGFLRVETPLTPSYYGKLSEEEYQKKILEGLNAIFDSEKDNIAAVLLEPVIASGGVFELPFWYTREVQRLCSLHDVMLIIDEVATGFMRTGERFGYMRCELTPDIVCMSKAITNGYIAFGAVAIGKKVADLYAEKNEFVEHFSTQNGNLLAPAIALEVLDLLKDDSVMANIKGLLEEIQVYDFSRMESISCVREVRRSGLMIAIDLYDSDKNPFGMERLMGTVKKIRDNGILVYEYMIENKVSGISIFPMYILKKSVISKVFGKLERCLLQV